MSIPRRFHRLYPSAPPACRSDQCGSSRCVVPDYWSGLFAPAVHSCLHQYTDTGFAVCLHCFPESSAVRPTGRWCGCMACRHGLAGVFLSAGRMHRRRSHSVQYGSCSTYFGQVIFGIVTGLFNCSRVYIYYTSFEYF